MRKLQPQLTDKPAEAVSSIDYYQHATGIIIVKKILHQPWSEVTKAAENLCYLTHVAMQPLWPRKCYVDGRVASEASINKQPLRVHLFLETNDWWKPIENWVLSLLKKSDHDLPFYKKDQTGPSTSLFPSDSATKVSNLSCCLVIRPVVRYRAQDSYFWLIVQCSTVSDHSEPHMSFNCHQTKH